ncbi:MAG: hypothetical protein IJM76_08785 [Lachnospiraceae bacterium]|nr:hypothetical protein [Lachnospiraceae bacterium]
MASEKSTKAAQEAARAAAEKAQKAAAEKRKVQHTYTQVGQQSNSKEELLAATRKNALPYRIGAIILWVVAIAFEVLAILIFTKKLQFGFTQENPGYTISWIVCLVLDLIALIIGSQLWKKGNHLDPAPAKNKARFFIQNNLGVIVAIIAFVPFLIIALLDKNADKKTKLIAVIAAVVALAIGGLTSVDWNPVSQEEMLDAAGVDTVYWTASGTVFHAFDDCQHLSRTVELLTGTSTAAIENGKTRMCKTCEARLAAEEVPDNSGIQDLTGGGEEEKELDTVAE